MREAGFEPVQALIQSELQPVYPNSLAYLGGGGFIPHCKTPLNLKKEEVDGEKYPFRFSSSWY